jgi:hypothetical protein
MALFNSAELVFVDCHAGKDRTGVVIACYRIAHDGWKADPGLERTQVLRHGQHPIRIEGLCQGVHTSHCFGYVQVNFTGEKE